MVITTVMTFFVIRYAYNHPWAPCFAATWFFVLIELVFFSANIIKGVLWRLVHAADCGVRVHGADPDLEAGPCHRVGSGAC